MTCPPHDSGCFSEDEKLKLNRRGWDPEQIEYAENSIIEDKIKELI